MAPTIDRIRFVVDENLLRMGRAIARRLVKWENIGDEALYKAAHAEIVKSGGGVPRILDPFCGGGTIPLEAQRLGLEAHASDLNPVAVLITKGTDRDPAQVRRASAGVPRCRRIAPRRLAQGPRPGRRRPPLRRVDA